MIFTTFAFEVFFVIVFSLYLAFKSRVFRHILLLVSSSFFYAWWDYRYLALMWTVILVSYGTGLLLEKRPQHRKLSLACGVTLLLGLLGVFKYHNFFLQSLAGWANSIGWGLNFAPIKSVLPVGISFYVFHGISYIVDAYRGIIPVEKNPMTVALYISYFPQLVAGPIVRASDFIPQLNRNVVVSEYYLATGLREFVLGFVYKTAFADSLAQFADPIFSAIWRYSNSSLVAATFAFYGQIYFDFAGYSLMAIGLARMMGYNFPPNFDYPYQSTSITEFWRRWHISLSTWLRNYLYFPLGGNRLGKLKQYRNLVITMLLGGLWHGASWNFVLWGGLHGMALAVHKLFLPEQRVEEKVHARMNFLILSWLITQLFVLLCWVPFRLPHFSQTMEVYSAFLRVRGDRGLLHASINYGLLFVPLAIDATLGKLDRGALEKLSAWVPEPRRALVICFVIGLMFALALTTISMTVNPFIYFQF